MISGSTWDKVREAWKAGIPEPYRWTGKDHTASNACYGAIIAPVPPAHMLTAFFKSLGPMHLAADQRRALARRKA